MNKKIVVPILTLVAVTTLSGIGLTKVQAQESSTSNLPPMIQRLVEKFNLNESEVSDFIVQERALKQEERKAELEQSLTNAVSEGKITETQKAELLTILGTNKGSDLHDLSPEERKGAMEEHRDIIQSWEEANNIELHDLGILGSRGKGMGQRDFGGRGNKNN